MENQNSPPEHETVGTLFRRLRLERALDTSDVCEETRIPERTIRAMEADDYASLPAHAFARGFYSLYAKLLDLDQEEILRRFSAECNGTDIPTNTENVPAPGWQSRDINTMAERPSITPGSIIGLGLLLIILTGAGISWYAGFNPATYISKWLRGVQEQAIPVEQQVTTPATDIALPDTQNATNEGLPPQSVPQPEEPSLPPENIKYRLVAEFQEPTRITITIDENESKSLQLPTGTIETWSAQEKITLELPADTTTRLYLNGIVIPLPPATDDKVIIAIPGALFD